MEDRKRRPAWALLYALAPAVLGLGWLDGRLPATPLEHRLVEWLGVGLLCLLVLLWLHSNGLALVTSTPVRLLPVARRRYLALPYEAGVPAVARRLEVPDGALAGDDERREAGAPAPHAV